MDFCKDLIDIDSESKKINEFYEFTHNIHNTMGCQQTDCDIFHFLKATKEFIYDPER